jgi:hypothetical protein
MCLLPNGVSTLLASKRESVVISDFSEFMLNKF